MDIEGLVSKVTMRQGHRTVTIFEPEGSDGRRVLALEMLSSGKCRLALLEDGVSPDLDDIDQIYIDKGGDVVAERMVRAMAIFHFGVTEAATGYSKLDVEMLSRGFELGFAGDDDSPVWIRLSSAMNVVIQKRDKNGLPSTMDDKVSMICIIPERNQIEYRCENVRTAFRTLDKNMPFKAAKKGDPDEMIILDVVDSETVVFH